MPSFPVSIIPACARHNMLLLSAGARNNLQQLLPIVFSRLQLSRHVSLSRRRSHILSSHIPVAMTINTFLEDVHARLRTNEANKITIVTGNDSAGIKNFYYSLYHYSYQLFVDLDSVVSALSFAYCSSQVDPTTLYVPLVKVPLADIDLRPEIDYVLSSAGIECKKLVYMDQIDVSKLETQETTSVVLVDHNRLTPPFTDEWNKKVVAVLDHHVDEGFYTNAVRRDVRMVGSCTSLVIHHFPDHFAPDTPLANIALGPILVDTIGLQWELGKTTDTDVDAFHKITKGRMNEADIKKRHEEIERVKSRVTHLCTRDLLRKDYKEWVVNGFRVGTSSMPWYLKAWIERDGMDNVIRDTQAYIQERHLDFEIVLTGYDHDGCYERELALFVYNDKLLVVKEALERDSSVDLTHRPFQPKDTSHIAFYHQGNVKMSRKQVWPLVQSLIENISK